MNRRNFCKSVGYLTGALTLNNTFANNNSSSLKHFIFVNLKGSPSQLETFDPKSHKNGGNTKQVNTRIRGVKFAENLANLAEISNELVVLKMSSKDANHETAQYFWQSGGYSKQGSLTHPSLVSIIGKFSTTSNSKGIPNAITLNNNDNIGAGYLGSTFNPFSIRNVYDAKQSFSLPERYKNSVDKTSQIQQDFYNLSPLKDGSEFKQKLSLQQKSLQLITPEVVNVFDLSKESSQQQRIFANNWEKQCLLASRLIENNVAAIELSFPGWDTHEDNFNRTKQLATTMDTALSKLVKRLKEKNLFDKTLILVGGEFGRTPKINNNDGRDHFAKVWSSCLISGGIKGGQVFGESSADGLNITKAVSVEQLSFTILKLLNINPNKWTQTAIGRPIKLSPGKTKLRI